MPLTQDRLYTKEAIVNSRVQHARTLDSYTCQLLAVPTPNNLSFEDSGWQEAPGEKLFLTAVTVLSMSAMACQMTRQINCHAPEPRGLSEHK